MSSLRLRLIVALLALVAALWFATRHHSSRSPVADRPVARTSASLPASATITDPAACAPDNAPPSDRFAAAIAARARREDALAKTAAFTDWLTAWRRADAATQLALAATGRQLATARRDALKHLIETDPSRALEAAVPVGLRSELPADVQALLEQRVDARGELEVSIVHAGGDAQIDRVVRIGDTSYRAFVFGRRERQQTKIGLPLHGIAIEGLIALEETPYRLLDDVEKVAAGAAPDQFAVKVGDKVTLLNSAAELTALSDRLTAAESVPGPAVSRDLRDTNDHDRNSPATAAVTSPTSWMHGAKRVLWVQVDMSDDTGPVASEADLATTNAAVSEFYNNTSYGLTTVSFTAVPVPLRLSRDKAYYNADPNSYSQISTEAKALAKQYDAANGNAGTYDPDRYDRWIVVFKGIPSFTFGGRGTLGGPTTWLHNNVRPSTTGHELGHNQSLDHSHAWLPTGSIAIGAGTHVEYGDVFDRMGTSGSTPENYFNVAQKAKLGYLEGASINTVTEAGTYRLTRHDHRNSTGARALRVGASNVEYDYWIEHRRVGPTALTAAQLDRLQNGVLIHWGPQKLPRFVTGAGSYLLDMTPGSSAGMSDAPLRIGEKFTDPDSGITIRPIAVGGAVPNEYIDVQVQFGAIDGNRNPVLVADAPTATVSARTNFTLSASATDPDGDSLYYRWDFGDGKLQPNLNNVTMRYTRGGSYPVTVSAHDGKGGIAVKTFTLNVADPLTQWTRRASGLTTNLLYDVLYAGNRFIAVGINQTILTSPDGVTWSPSTIPNGNSLTGVAHNGTRYVISGYRFSNATQKGLAAYSDNGTQWTLVPIDTGLAQFWGAAFGAGRFVMVGDQGIIYSSVDGAAWTPSPTGVTNSLRAVTFAEGLFVATGDAGRLFTSPDGITWTNRSLPTTNQFFGAVRHNGQWHVRNGASIYRSPDGVTWTRVTGTNAVNLVAFKPLSVPGVLLSPSTNGTIDLTEDAQRWSPVQLDTTAGASFRSTTLGNGTIVAVGSGGLIYSAVAPTQSTPPLPAPSLRNEADSIKVSVGRKNILSAGGPGYAKLELYANGTKVSEINGASGAFTWTPTVIGNYSLIVRGVDASGASAVSAAYPAQAAAAAWNWRNPSPVGNDLYGGTRVGDKWWIVGRCGAFVTIDSAGEVLPVDFATTQDLYGIAYANGRFTIAARYYDDAAREAIGSLWTSTDGYDWSPLLTDTDFTPYTLYNVNYAAGQWLAAGLGGVMLTSRDGLEWTRQVTGTTAALRSSAHNGSLWVIVGTGGKIITSPDGATWTDRPSGVTVDLRGVTFANGQFVATGLSGTVLTSPNGITWTRRTISSTQNLYGTAYIGSNYAVAGDNGTVFISTDAVTWTTVSIASRSSHAFFLAGSNGDGLFAGRGGEFYTFTPAASWKRGNSGTADNHTSALFGGGRFVVGGAISDGPGRATVASILTSPNGTTWTRAAANTAFNTINALAHSGSLYLAAADSGRIFTSPDATTWTQRTSGVTTQLLAAAARPGGYVAAGANGTILSSTDGATWESRTSGVTTTLRAAASGNNRFVVVGDGGVIRTSPDGVTWTAAASGTTSALLNVSWFDTYGFIAAGANGMMIGSRDGATWQVIDTGITDTINSVSRAPFGYAAAAGTSGTLLISLDAENWSIATVPLDRAVRGLAGNASTLVAVGDSGALLTFDLVDNTPAPVITAPPVSQTGAAGSSITFTVGVQNASGGVYQWLKDGVPIVGANSPVYTITAATSAHLGDYSVAITTANGKSTSTSATLSFGAVADPGRLGNLSILTQLTGPADDFTFGVVIGGAGTASGKALLVRAAGPSLTTLGVSGVLDDPKLEFFTGSTKVGENDNWAGNAATAAMITQVGAFPFSGPASRDAALAFQTLPSGANSAKISGTGAGTVIAELYDATPAQAFTASTPRLINVSVLKHLGSGVTAGFVIAGSTSRVVLIRAVGPTLGTFGVAGVVADPQLALFRGQTQIGANNDWGGSAALGTTFTQVGAFGMAANSKDAALRATLDPGSYTVQVSGVGGTTGVALIEIYEVPE